MTTNPSTNKQENSTQKPEERISRSPFLPMTQLFNCSGYGRGNETRMSSDQRNDARVREEQQRKKEEKLIFGDEESKGIRMLGSWVDPGIDVAE